MGVLAQHIGLPDEETQKLILLSLMHFSDLDDTARFYVISSHKLIPKIVKYIGHDNPQMSLYAVQAAGNLALGDKKITLV